MIDPLPRSEDIPLIRASELAQYSFCHRAWWLGTVKGIPAQNQAALARGNQIHSYHGRQVKAALYWRRGGWFLVGSGSLILIAALVWLWLI